MQHRALLTVNAYLILLVNYGQTDDICGAGKIRRGDKCCLSQLCVDTGFAECTVSNTKDTCVPCNKGFYLIGQYETSNFPDSNVCAVIKKCSPEEVKNEDGECVCDGSRSYYRIDEGLCGLVQLSCTPAGRQLSFHGHCDPCPEGYFKPVSGKQRCINKSNITCSSPEMILEGNTTTDRKCLKNDDIMSTSTYSPPLSTYINITNDDIDRNGNNVFLTGLLIGVLGVGLFIIVVVGIILLIRYYRRQQSQDIPRVRTSTYDLESNENVEDVAEELIDDDNLEDMTVPYQSPRNNIPNDDFGYVPLLFESLEDNNSYDVDNIDRGHTYKKVPDQSPQDNIPNVTDRQQVIDDTIYDASHSCEVEVVTRDTSQTYVKVPYPSHSSSIDSAVRGVIPSRDEDNLSQQDRSFNPLSGDDRSCQGAVDGGIDDNDTPSSINNDIDINLLIDQPEHNSQPGRIVLGLQSFNLPVPNPNANLPHHLPQNHGGSSEEDDSGFQN